MISKIKYIGGYQKLNVNGKDFFRDKVVEVSPSFADNLVDGRTFVKVEDKPTKPKKKSKITGSISGLEDDM